MLTDLQKKTAQGIVNIFETGSLVGEYGLVTLLAGDSGHLTYGRSQTTLGSGNLFFLIADYCEAEGAQYADALTPFLGRLEARDVSFDHDMDFRRTLKAAGDDPVMQTTQDAFFDRVYWTPSARHALSTGIETPLGVGVVYDSHIHGSWPEIRNKVNRAMSLADVGEQTWVGRYVAERRAWLASRQNAYLRTTVYRMDAFRRLIDDENWSLGLPIRVRGVWITREALTDSEAVRVSAHTDTKPILRLKDPRMRGKSVRSLQEALRRNGSRMKVDDVFGPNTKRAVVAFQRRSDLKADGIVGPATWSMLDATA